MLAEQAAVVTSGSASAWPVPDILGHMLAAPRWYIATDADDAGEKAADRWEAVRARRVRPPAQFKDWTEARQGGVDLTRWWTDRLGGNESPKLYTFDELTGWPGLDSEPGIINRPDPDRRPALEALAVPDLDNAPKGASARSVSKPESKGHR
jgi:hypothetical protein